MATILCWSKRINLTFAGARCPRIQSLEREEPGEFQEQEVARLLWRVFPWTSVIVNPVRVDTGRELCDILVTQPDSILIIQAKDSPNTEASLRRSNSPQNCNQHFAPTQGGFPDEGRPAVCGLARRTFPKFA